MDKDKQFPEYKLSGQLIGHRGQPMVGLLVRVYDADATLLGETLTGKRGDYRLGWDERRLSEGGTDAEIELFIRAFDKDELVGQSAPQRTASPATINLTLAEQTEKQPKEPEFSVIGVVHRPDRQPVADALVRAYDQGLRKARSLLGETKTDPSGRYAIGFSSGALLNRKQGTANLVIEAYDNNQRMIASSAVRFNASRTEKVSLTVDDGIELSEWTRIEALSASVLKEIPLCELTHDDIGHLAKSHRLSSKLLQAAQQAACSAKTSDLPDWFHYALIRQGGPADLGALLETPEARISSLIKLAVEAKVISAPSKRILATTMATLSALQTDKTLTRALPGKTLQLGKLFELAALSREQQTKLAKSLVGKNLSQIPLYDQLAADRHLDKKTAARLRFTWGVAELADGHEAAVSVLVKDDRLKGLRDVARYYDPDDWHKLVERSLGEDGRDLPEDIEGDKPAARRHAYAQRLYQRVARQYPTIAIAHGLPRREGLAKHPAVQSLLRVVEADESFDLASARLDTYVSERAEALDLTSADDIAATVTELRRVQRLYRLKPEMPVVARLLEDGLDSATAILHQGKRKFVDQYGDDDAFGKDKAIALYRQAESNAAQAFGFYAHFSPTINTSPLPAAISKCPAALKEVPDYPTLFGSLDGCACGSCESVYSPAAYLTDVLAFLERHVEPIPNYFEAPELAVDNGLDALASRRFCNRKDQLMLQPRRGDIVNTLLSCRNAETELPFIDLVLEILEEAVAPRSGAETLQTNWSAEQLAGQGEHFNPAAYTTLAGAIYPFELPFDLAHEETRVYLSRLGTAPAELLEALYPFAASQDSANVTNGEPHDLTEIRRWQDPKIARAWLQLSETAWNTITETRTTNAVIAPAWGYSVSNNWWRKLSNVDKLLARSGVDFNDLLRLLGLKCFNPKSQVRISDDDLSECDPKQIDLVGLSAAVLGFLHRFLRLQRSLDWSMQDLDRTLLDLAPPVSVNARPALDSGFLIRLTHLLRLQSKFHLPLPELLSWWADLDTRDYAIPQLPHDDVPPSLYDQLFQMGRPGEPGFDAFRLAANRNELSDPDQPLDNHHAVIAGALRLSQPGLSQLIGALGDGLVHDVNGDYAVLNLANLSMLHRHASLARALRLTITDYLTLKRLIGFDPFAAAQLSSDDAVEATLQTLRFVQRAEALASSNFTIAEVDYVIRQTLPFEGDVVAPTAGWVAEAADALKASIMSSDAETPAAPDDLTNDNADQTQIQLGALATTLANLLEVSVPVCRILLEHVVAATVPARSALEVLVNALSPQTDAPPADGGVAEPDEGDEGLLSEVLYRLHKAALVIKRLGIDDHELLDEVTAAPRYLELSPTVGWLDLTQLPIRAVDGMPDTIGMRIDGWMRTVQLFKLRDTLPDHSQPELFTLFDIAAQHQPGTQPFAEAERRAYIDRLVALTGWPEPDVRALVGPFDIGQLSEGGGGLLRAVFPAHFADERLPLRIAQVVHLLNRLGVSALEVEAWLDGLTGQPVGNQVERIKSALKARYQDEWLQVLKPIRDPLRIRQRDALVTFLMHTWQLQRADDLFDHFLIDVEMSPCMMTSRLIQAIASVQLFVQRIQMNLEPGLALSGEGAAQWEWMKNYRVWEANRKVFLYPENWIEPDLRDDKTPFFRDLENELMQADLSNESAETALLHYLEKLHDVARLQVCGQYLDTDSNPFTLHVFARTRDVPHRYFYRRGILDFDLETLIANQSHQLDSDRLTDFIDAHWTPWEAVDVDVEGDHLIPMVYNRRVYLFWPVFTSEDEAPLTRTFQELLSFYGQLFRLVMTTGELIGSLAQGAGVTIIGGLANGIIQLLYSLQRGFNDLIPGDGGPLNLLDQREAVRDIRTALLSALGVPASDAVSHDNTQTLIEYSGLNSFDELGDTFQSMLGLLQQYESYLLSFLPAKRLEVQLAWSEFKNDSWSAKKTSSGVVTFRDVISTLFESLTDLPGLATVGVKRLFTFRGEVDQYNQLFVRCQIALPTSLLDSATYATDQWLSEPLEIGHFRYDVCSAQMEPVDTAEHVGIVDLLSQGVSQFLIDAGSAIDSLALQNDRQLQQRGVPVTPDDDPVRPSMLRYLLDIMPLPEHAFPPFQRPRDLDPYRILARHHEANDLYKLFGFFYHDTRRTFFCFPWRLPDNPPGARTPFGFVFFPFYHPYTCELIESIQRGGIPAIYAERYELNDQLRLIPSDDETAESLQLVLRNDAVMALPEYDKVTRVYNPVNGPRELRPIEEFNFSTIGAHSQYNWEIFFHIPLLIATRFSTDQQFREAQHWFHYIFNPTDASRGSTPQKYWRTRPFVETSESDYHVQDIDQLLLLLSDEASVPGLQEIERAVRRWRRDAFNPHLVARSRTVAFQKAVVMKYIDNLIAWGDALFRRETSESVNEALQLYVLAAKLLGPRPRRIPQSVKRPEKSFAELHEDIDAFSNVLVEFENFLPSTETTLGVGNHLLDWSRRRTAGPLDRQTLNAAGGSFRDLLSSASMRNLVRRPEKIQDLYFCVPPNAQLLDKWDIVADRLFKLRHCQNIEGQALSLGLLGPPIDPAILVRAKAMGVDIDSLLGELNNSSPNYRFQALTQKATELCAEVKALGAALLSALEKRDGEALALLRNSHESRLLEAVIGIREKQLEEAQTGLEGLKCSRDATTLRRDHYLRLLTEFMNPEEMVNTALGAMSLIVQVAQFGTTWGASAASLIPNIKGGFVTTLGGTYGGDNIKGAAENAAQAMGLLSSILSSTGGLISTMGGYRRRAEDWLLQIGVANLELKGLEKQIQAAGLRVEIVQTELDNQKLQIQHNLENQAFMQSKFTNQELYDWMITQTSTLFFQSYQLAYDMARQAQRAFSFELGVEAPGIIQYGYWDNLKKGLLSGERLQQDLKRLEVAYLNQNTREFELTKHVSLSALDPLQLIRLREIGEAEFSLPEALFDMDFPGHYMRRIKAVSVSIPCITGPYDGVSAILRLTKSRVRCKPDLTGGIYEASGDDDPRFRPSRSARRVIATSSAQNDSGLFELNFRDERFLPFEGEGAESQWSLTINKSFAQFDLNTISDVVMHIRYTARDAGDALRAAAVASLANLQQALVNIDGEPQPLTRLFSIRHDFPTEWAGFRGQTPEGGQRYKLALKLGEQHYPFWTKGRLNSVFGIGILARPSESFTADTVNVFRESTTTSTNLLGSMSKDSTLNDLLVGKFNETSLPTRPVAELDLYFDENKLADMWIAVTMSAPAAPA